MERQRRANGGASLKAKPNGASAEPARPANDAAPARPNRFIRRAPSRKPARPLRSNPAPELFELEPVAQHDTRQLIKACVRSGYSWSAIQRDVLKDMLETVNRYGRLGLAKHHLLMVFARRCGVAPVTHHLSAGLNGVQRKSPAGFVEPAGPRR